jgi:DNA polymerase III subunit delta'
VTPLFGHDEAVAAVRAGLDSGRLHHAWLIAGPPGVGKGLFARKAGLRAVAEGQGYQGPPNLDVPDDFTAARWVAAEAHPDFKLVEREVWEKNKKDVLVPKDKRSGEDPARNIRVAQIRSLRESLASTTSVSKRRAVVIDSIDDLEPAAANALLKSLEEPPASTVFFLVSHSPERLLPTIRSRCRLLRLGPLDRGAMEQALRFALPDAPADEIAALAEAGQGAPGRALGWRGLDMPGLERSLKQLAATGDPANAQRSSLAFSLSQKAARRRYEAFLARAPAFIAAEARTRRGAPLAAAIRLWERASTLAATAPRESLDPQATAFEMCGLVASLAAGSRPASRPRSG